ncbi:MAG TPA: thiamine phosphate synthase [Acidimicrobiales bacterium]|nr:thiamine phosphate synthase [Acidimicrobiales bacterium]
MSGPEADPGAEPLARLHVITPAGSPETLTAAVEAALAGGAPLVQLRTKEGSDRARWELARAVAGRCRAAGARLVVNDRADLAAAAGADGVHLGADDLPVPAARRLLGPVAVIGTTCRDAAGARRAEADGASYVGVGPVYPTATKSGLPAAMGPDGVQVVSRAVSIPVIAIGGVDAGRVAEVVAAGAWGVAVCGAVFSAVDPQAAVEELAEAIGQAAGTRR